MKEHRAAKEIWLKQKAEMKQAAALGMAKPSALQTGTSTVTDITYKPGQVKIEKENSSHYSGHMDSHLTIFKPGKPNSIHSHRCVHYHYISFLNLLNKLLNFSCLFHYLN